MTLYQIAHLFPFMESHVIHDQHRIGDSSFIEHSKHIVEERAEVLPIVRSRLRRIMENALAVHRTTDRNVPRAQAWRDLNRPRSA